jgi:hypothetical protein
MMHRRGKSDLVIVAVKLANKVERSAAELVERRAGAKGNADQQSTSRTLSRTSVIQALGRIPRTALSRGHSPEAGAVCVKFGTRPCRQCPIVHASRLLDCSSVRAFAVKPRAFGAPLRGCGA